ncbi:MAG: sulfatase-like hydrolase/transferase [Bacteroidales bacterium]|nr:sulfatase-like hydrolase/transferase [Bacteroidales bacterium]
MRFKIILLMLTLLGTTHSSFSESPERVILFMIDGLHWEAPSRLDMPVFNSLIKEGTYIQKSYMLLPHHPTVGDYSKYNSCSFPNPVLHEGTVFIQPENKYIQEVFSPARQTAFVVNTAAYRSVARGFTTSIMDPSLSDKQVVEQAEDILKQQDPIFMRMHLQTPGDLGTNIALKSGGKPYSQNIFGEGSPYVSSIEEADQLLGRFITFLKKEGKWESTVLIVTSDHGQSKIGWHPLFDEDSWATPMVITGAGIAKGRVLPYFEHTDLAPTIAWLLGAEAPNNDGGAGIAVKEIMGNTNTGDYHPRMYIKTLNQQVKEFNILKSGMILRAEKQRTFSNTIATLENENLTPEPFYHQDRVMDWYKAGSFEHLLKANEKILQQMREELGE